MKWVRTCQECDHKQVTTKPPQDRELSDAYRDAKCKRCGSMGLDYGREIDD